MATFRSTIAKLVGYLWTGILGAIGWPIVFFGKRATFAFGLFWAIFDVLEARGPLKKLPGSNALQLHCI